MNFKKTALSFVTVAVMAASLCPLGAFAEGEESTAGFHLITKPYQIDKYTAPSVSPDDVKAWIAEHHEEIADEMPEGVDWAGFSFRNDDNLYLYWYDRADLASDEFDIDSGDFNEFEFSTVQYASLGIYLGYPDDFGTRLFGWADELETRTELTTETEDIDKGIIISPDEALLSEGGKYMFFDSDINEDFNDIGNKDLEFTNEAGSSWGGVSAFYYNGDGRFVCFNYGWLSVLIPEDGMTFKVRLDPESGNWHIDQFPELTAVEAADPTCEEGGNTAYWFYTEDVGEQEMVYHYFSDKNGNYEIEEGSWEIAPLDHDWSAWEPHWAEDGSACTATRVCSRDETHTETVKATVTSEVKIPATEDEMGTTLYTAKFDVEGIDDQTLELQDIPKLEPEDSTPDSTTDSTPDSSTPDASTPDASTPDSTAPTDQGQGTNPGTGAAAGLGVLAAVAAAAIVVKKRR